MATQAPTARSRAIATQDQQIAANVAKIEDAKRHPSAIEAMAGRLALSPGNLKNTLMNTVFKGASEAEFAALIVVSNAYGLNPLLKEIYAFPAKGGGIIPVVSVDGWIRIMNEHPQFDGIEFNDIVDEGGSLYAIEAVIYRRDRTHPIKVTEYMDECKGTSPAWQKVPKRMLRHRSLIQGSRVAFGFSGIHSEDEAETFVQQDGGERARNVTPPTRAEVETYDPDTGEVDEDTARDLDRQGFAAMDRADDDHPGTALAATLIALFNEAETPADVDAAMAEFRSAIGDLDSDGATQVEDAAKSARARVAK